MIRFPDDKKIDIARNIPMKDFDKSKLKLRNLEDVNEIILHCSDTNNISVDVLEVHNWHKKRGWAGCGYHYFIRTDGAIQQGRRLDWVGCHCEGHNTNSVGICLNGKTEFTGSQARSLYWLLHQIIVPNKSKPFLKAIRISPHNRYSNEKTCPNFDVNRFLQVNELRTFIGYKDVKKNNN